MLVDCVSAEEALQNHPCTSSPCENHGTCITVGQKGAFYCACVIGTAGDRCQGTVSVLLLSYIVDGNYMYQCNSKSVKLVFLECKSMRIVLKTLMWTL